MAHDAYAGLEAGMQISRIVGKLDDGLDSRGFKAATANGHAGDGMMESGAKLESYGCVRRG